MNAARLALFALLSTACEQEIQDTEGRTFEIQCEKEACHLALQGEHAGSNPANFAPTRSGRLLLACPAERGDGRDCRPLACDGDSPCSRLGGEGTECLDGLCQAPSKALTSEDRLALCLAGTGTWSDSALQRSRFALSLSCRPPCEVPAECQRR